MRVRVTWHEVQYYEAEVELDKVPVTEIEGDEAFRKATSPEAPDPDSGDCYVRDVVFEEVK